MKKFLFPIITLLIAFLMTGCGSNITKSVIKDFVKEEYGLSDCKVDSKPTLVRDYNGYEDEIWYVTAHDESDTEFEVFVDRTHSSLGRSYLLKGNYYDKLLNSYADSYDLKELEITEEDYEGFTTTKMVGYFSNKGELKALFEETNSLRLLLKNDGLEMDFDVLFCMNNPLRDALHDQPDGSIGKIVEDGDFEETFTTKPASQKLVKNYSDAISGLVNSALDYQLEGCLVGMSEEEISEIYESDCRKIGIAIGGDEDNVKYYDGICANRMGYGISFGSLYKVLAYEGFDVEGDAWHYSFVSPEGNKYEISYDFIDELEYTEGLQRGYYYLVDGEVVPMRFYFYNHFPKGEVKAMTGLSLVW